MLESIGGKFAAAAIFSRAQFSQGWPIVSVLPMVDADQDGGAGG